MSHYKYKVVKEDLTSISGLRNSFSIKYARNVFRNAKIGGLLVFKTLKQAKAFAGVDNYKIFACEVQGSVKLPKYRSYSCESIKEAWENNFYFDKEFWPDGTQAYKRVKLLYEVK